MSSDLLCYRCWNNEGKGAGGCRFAVPDTHWKIVEGERGMGCDHYTPSADFDVAYAKERNKLIPDAVAFADRMHGKTGPERGESAREWIKAREVWAANWNRAYHQQMNFLWGLKRRSA